jgi:SAM-dependent methyltransferase
MALNNEKFYTNAYEKHGISAQGVNWNSKESQEIRFGVITDLLGDELLAHSVVDAGCGFGEFYLFCKKLELAPLSYIGLDCVRSSIDICLKRFEDKQNCSFTCKDILKDDLPRADWYIASGSLNILSRFETWLFLEKMLENSQKGIIFNILQGYIRSKNFNYQNKEDIKEFAKSKNLDIVIVNGYLKNDMTIRMIK